MCFIQKYNKLLFLKMYDRNFNRKGENMFIIFQKRGPARKEEIRLIGFIEGDNYENAISQLREVAKEQGIKVSETGVILLSGSSLYLEEIKPLDKEALKLTLSVLAFLSNMSEQGRLILSASGSR